MDSLLDTGQNCIKSISCNEYTKGGKDVIIADTPSETDVKDEPLGWDELEITESCLTDQLIKNESDNFFCDTDEYSEQLHVACNDGSVKPECENVSNSGTSNIVDISIEDILWEESQEPVSSVESQKKKRNDNCVSNAVSSKINNKILQEPLNQFVTCPRCHSNVFLNCFSAHFHRCSRTKVTGSEFIKKGNVLNNKSPLTQCGLVKNVNECNLQNSFSSNSIKYNKTSNRSIDKCLTGQLPKIVDEYSSHKQLIKDPNSAKNTQLKSNFSYFTRSKGKSCSPIINNLKKWKSVPNLIEDQNEGGEEFRGFSKESVSKCCQNFLRQSAGELISLKMHDYARTPCVNDKSISKSVYSERILNNSGHEGRNLRSRRANYSSTLIKPRSKSVCAERYYGESVRTSEEIEQNNNRKSRSKSVCGARYNKNEELQTHPKSQNLTELVQPTRMITRSKSKLNLFSNFTDSDVDNEDDILSSNKSKVVHRSRSKSFCVGKTATERKLESNMENVASSHNEVPNLNNKYRCRSKSVSSSTHKKVNKTTAVDMISSTVQHGVKTSTNEKDPLDLRSENLSISDKLVSSSTGTCASKPNNLLVEYYDCVNEMSVFQILPDNKLSQNISESTSLCKEFTLQHDTDETKLTKSVEISDQNKNKLYIQNSNCQVTKGKTVDTFEKSDKNESSNIQNLTDPINLSNSNKQMEANTLSVVNPLNEGPDNEDLDNNSLYYVSMELPVIEKETANFKMAQERILHCSFCSFVTRKRGTLKSHEKSHRKFKVPIVKCPYCPKRYTKFGLGVHMEGSHAEKYNAWSAKKYKGNVKNKTPNKALLHYKNVVLEDNNKSKPSVTVTLQCCQCSFVTAERSSLEEHFNKNHLKSGKINNGNPRNVLNCGYCSYTTTLRHNLSRHEKTHVLLKLPIKKCKKCDYKSTPLALRVHERKCKPGIKKNQNISQNLQRTGVKEKRSNTSNTDKAVNSKLMRCKFCSFTTFWRNSLSNHIKTHNLKLSNKKCPWCNFKSTPYALRMHLLTCKSKNPKISSKPAVPNRNVLNYKTNVKDIRCKYCSVRCSSKYKMDLHMKSHTELNLPVKKCPNCSFKATSSALYRHKLKCIDKKDIDPKCKYCSAIILSTFNMMKHIKTHTILKLPILTCPNCNSFKSTRKILNKHMEECKKIIKNSGQCPYCSAKFMYPSKMNIHMRTHTVLKLPIKKCSNCDFKSTNLVLRRHMEKCCNLNSEKKSLSLKNNVEMDSKIAEIPNKNKYFPEQLSTEKITLNTIKCNSEEFRVVRNNIGNKKVSEIDTLSTKSISLSVEDLNREEPLNKSDENQRSDHSQSNVDNSGYNVTGVDGKFGQKKIVKQLQCKYCSAKTTNQFNMDQHVLTHTVQKLPIRSCLNCDFKSTHSALQRHMQTCFKVNSIGKSINSINTFRNIIIPRRRRSQSSKVEVDSSINSTLRQRSSRSQHNLENLTQLPKGNNELLNSSESNVVPTTILNKMVKDSNTQIPLQGIKRKRTNIRDTSNSQLEPYKNVVASKENKSILEEQTDTSLANFVHSSEIIQNSSANSNLDSQSGHTKSNKNDSNLEKSVSTSDETKDLLGKVFRTKPEFKCEMCPFTTQMRIKLKMHKKKHHSNPDISNGRVDVYTKKLNKCRFCSAEISNKFNMQTHVKMHTVFKLPNKKCANCNFKSTPNCLRKHELNCLKKNTSVISTDKKKEISILSSNIAYKKKYVSITSKLSADSNAQMMHKKVQFKCQLCPFITSMRIMLKVHIRKKHSAHAESSEKSPFKSLSKEKTQKMVKLSKTKEYICRDTTTSVQNHKTTLAKQKCNDRDSKTELCKTVTQETPSFNCDLCSFTATMRIKLKIHKKKYHEVSKSIETNHKNCYRCQYCSFVAPTKTHLSVHLRTHTHLALPVNKCSTCDFESTPKILKYHETEFHFLNKDSTSPDKDKDAVKFIPENIESQKEYTTFDKDKCKYCSANISDSKKMNRHIQTHTVVQQPIRKCLYCDFRSTYSMLKRHKAKCRGNYIKKSVGNLGKIKENLQKTKESVIAAPSNAYQKYGKQEVDSIGAFTPLIKSDSTGSRQWTFNSEMLNNPPEEIKSSDLLSTTDKMDDSRVFKCNYCLFATMEVQNLNDHMQSHTQSTKSTVYELPLIKCKYCNFCSTPRTLDKHLLRCKNNPENSNENLGIKMASDEYKKQEL